MLTDEAHMCVSAKHSGMVDLKEWEEEVPREEGGLLLGSHFVEGNELKGHADSLVQSWV